MYLLDWKIPKRLHLPSDTLYSMWAGNAEAKPSTKLKMKQAVSCFVYNACYWMQLGLDEIGVVLHKNAYSSPLLYNCNRVNRSVSWKYSVELFSWLHNKELGTLTVGGVEGWDASSGRVVPAKCKQSTLKLSEGLMGLFKAAVEDTPIQMPLSVVEVRGRDGMAMEVPDRDVRGVVDLINNYNQGMRDCVISLEGKRYFVQAKKVFNMDLCFGGRTYLTGPAVTGELLKRDKRGLIMIDNEPTVTLDYKYLHPAIIATQEGYDFPVGFDPYAISLNGYDQDILRKISKVAMLCMINAENEKSAMCGLSWDLFDNLKDLQQWKEMGKIPSVVGAKSVMDKLKDNNPYASKYFFSGYGLTLQNIDSKIIDYVMGYWNQKGVSIIPIHDSITIQEKYKDECESVMIEAYSKVLGNSRNCKVALE